MVFVLYPEFESENILFFTFLGIKILEKNKLKFYERREMQLWQIKKI